MPLYFLLKEGSRFFLSSSSEERSPTHEFVGQFRRAVGVVARCWRTGLKMPLDLGGMMEIVFVTLVAAALSCCVRVS